MSFAGGSTASNGSGHWGSPRARHCARSATGAVAGIERVSSEPRDVAGDSNTNTRAALNRRTNVMSTPCAPPKPTDSGGMIPEPAVPTRVPKDQLCGRTPNALERATTHRDGELNDPAPSLRRLPHRRHVIRHVDINDLDPIDFATPDLEQLEHTQRRRRLEARDRRGAVREFEVGDHTIVVEKGARQHELALLINQRETAVAQSAVESVSAFLELLGAGQLGRRVAGVRVTGADVTVLHARALVIESREQLPVVLL